MSGIVGIVHFDGAPVDRQVLGRLTAFMAFRGPDSQEIWIDGHAGLGHASLKTTEESEHERQPFTLDGRIWIVADARVDARRELIAKLKTKGHENLSPNATDAELILLAYLVWGEDCVEHLLGDFAFAIWDGPQQRLFCARDHLGVKPFFYAHLGQKLVFSSSLDCIRQHPAVSDRLNDLAIADFLLFDLNQDLATTSFADIQRIPPAHTATWSSSGLQLLRYWTLPIDEPLYFRNTDDYVDRFNELLDQAVDDRLRTKKVGVMMSGGLDSPTLAATAWRILRGRSADCEVLASTTLIDGFDRNERYYAGLVAERLGIPIRNIRGVLPFFGHGLGSVIDARERFLAPGGRMIPRCDTVWIAGVHAPELYQERLGPWGRSPYDFDMSAAHSRAINSIDQCWLATDQLFLEPRCLATLDYMTLKQTDLDATVSWTVDHACQGHGIVLWFDSVLAEGVTFTNRPGAPRLIYRQEFFPWPIPLEVCPGDTVTVQFLHDSSGTTMSGAGIRSLPARTRPTAASCPFASQTFLVLIFLSRNCGPRLPGFNRGSTKMAGFNAAFCRLWKEPRRWKPSPRSW